MNSYSIQRKVGITVCGATLLMTLTNFIAKMTVEGKSVAASIMDPAVSGLFAVLVGVGLISFFNNRILRYAQALLFFGLSGPTIVSASSMAFFGFWFLIIGVVLLYKYGFFLHFAPLKFLAVVAWSSGWIMFFILREGIGSVLTGIDIILFLAAAVLSLYFIFEENIRELVSANKEKDAQIARQREQIAQMEPLTVLGEKVSHVAHSFKNNLTQVSAALFYLEKGWNPVKAAERLRIYSSSMLERIDNILMISQAGGLQEIELLDLPRMIDGVQFILLEEKVFAKNAKIEIDAKPGVMVKAGRWDVVLLLENLFKNAIEAIVDSGRFGAISIMVGPGELRVADDGGAMETCRECKDSEISCRDCQRFRKPGYTTKVGGSGQGLYQVFQTVKKYDWNIRVQSGGDITVFIITFPVLEAEAPKPPELVVEAPPEELR